MRESRVPHSITTTIIITTTTTTFTTSATYEASVAPATEGQMATGGGEYGRGQSINHP